MKKYELTLVLTEEIGKDEAKQKKLLEDLFAGVEAKVVDKNILGVRDLAYLIKSHDKGWYGMFTIEMPEEKAEELDRAIRLNEKILRNLLIAKE